MKIIICTDAWHPQVNGVVRTLDTTIEHLKSWGHDVVVIHAFDYRGFTLPIYKEIRMCYRIKMDRLVEEVESVNDVSIHIATEGPIGLAARKICKKKEYFYTTAYHTNFPGHLKKMASVPEGITYGYLRWFHKNSSCIMVAIDSIAENLKKKNFKNKIGKWSRGVDLKLFQPRKKTPRDKPIALYVGRVSVEKDIQNFLKCKGNYEKIVVGDGPDKHKYEKKYPDVKFIGYLHGEQLAQAYANADVFVFPSKTDTFGLVMIESLACGVPVAAYPVLSPIDVIKGNGVGCLSNNLEKAIATALEKGVPEKCRQLAQQYSWEKCTRQFMINLVPAKPDLSI